MTVYSVDEVYLRVVQSHQRVSQCTRDAGATMKLNIETAKPANKPAAGTLKRYALCIVHIYAPSSLNV